MPPLQALMGEEDRMGPVTNGGPFAILGAAVSEGAIAARPWQDDRVPARTGKHVFGWMAIALILLFWMAQFVFLTVNQLMLYPSAPFIVPRAIVTACAVPISYFIFCALRAVRGGGLARRARSALGLAFGGCLTHSLINMVALILFGGQEWSTVPVEYLLGLGSEMIRFGWYYVALTVMLLALTYGQDLVENEKRIAALEAQANAAQLDALRYQLKPHFLFSALNSVASLISKGMESEAEAMVVSLSDLLRSTLRMDSGLEITLDEEIKLQSLYLDIEKARFPHRLKVTIDVPDALRDACVPNLITQPLIENAIKHGVGRSSAPVHLEVIARDRAGQLSLEIRDDGGNAGDSAPSGSTVGLRSVAERLKLRFGSEASMVAASRPGGGFSARILIPLQRA